MLVVYGEEGGEKKSQISHCCTIVINFLFLGKSFEDVKVRGNILDFIHSYELQTALKICENRIELRVKREEWH
jgi:hypothetical protein